MLRTANPKGEFGAKRRTATNLSRDSRKLENEREPLGRGELNCLFAHRHV